MKNRGQDCVEINTSLPGSPRARPPASQKSFVSVLARGRDWDACSTGRVMPNGSPNTEPRWFC